MSLLPSHNVFPRHARPSQDWRKAHLRNGVGLAVEGQRGSLRADSGVGSVDLSGVDNGAVGGSGSTCNEGGGSNEESGELHLD